MPNGEFEKAQANLRANVLAGRPNDGFRYTGIPGTQPLPITFAHFNGNQGNPITHRRTTATMWTNTTVRRRARSVRAEPDELREQSLSGHEHAVPTGL
jgi:hypothetical protein